MSSCDVLNCLFLLGVQNEIQLLSRLFCNSWLVCLLPLFVDKCTACQSHQKRTNSVRGLYDKKGPHSTVYLRRDEKKYV